MHHNYETEAIVLARIPHGEKNYDLLLLTPHFGLIRARAQGIRASGAKLAGSFQTLTECSVRLVKGKDVWRVRGGSPLTLWSQTLSSSSKERAGKVAGLLIRLLHGEVEDETFYDVYKGLLEALKTDSREEQEAAECLAVLRILQALGLDAGELPGVEYKKETLATVLTDQRSYIARINRGIAASGL